MAVLEQLTSVEALRLKRRGVLLAAAGMHRMVAYELRRSAGGVTAAAGWASAASAVFIGLLRKRAFLIL